MCDISDHFPMFTCKKVITHTCKQISMTSYYKVRNQSEVNMIKLYEKLSNESWNAIHDTDNVDEAYNNFRNTVSTLYNECCPFRNVQPQKILSKPWMTKQLINACKKKKSLYINFYKNRSN